MIKRIGLEPENKNKPSLPLAPAVQAGDFVFTSGQAALDADGNLINGGIVEQTHKTINNIKAVLSKAGCTLEDVVKVTVWLDDPRDFAAFNRAYVTYFGDHPPARSTVVSHLVIDGKIEIEAIAYKSPTS